MNQPVGWICWILMASLSRSLDFPSLFISLDHLLFLSTFLYAGHRKVGRPF